ncbi:MAG: GNAT family N-acetyltransferase [Gammaproteobacteria bacterium]
MALAFRPIGPDDQAFLLEVYVSTRREELALVDWDEDKKARFLQMQFAAQHRYYQDYYTDTDFLIILMDELPVGRLYLARWPGEIRIVDLALLSTHRNVGIGTRILRDMLAEATLAGKPVRIHVEKLNLALRLYERLGFTRIADKGVYWLLEWNAPLSLSDQVKIAS